MWNKIEKLLGVDEVSKEIKAIYKELNKIDHVNRGGCAIVAYGVVEYLKSNHPNIDATVVYLFRGDFDGYRECAKGNATSCAHAVVKIGDKYYDSEGVYSERVLATSLPKFWHTTQEFVLKSVNGGGWNPLFDREYGVPKIAEILGLPHVNENVYKYTKEVGGTHYADRW